MSSVIHYRFKAGSSEWSRIAFEGHAIPLYELKRQIVIAKKLNPLAEQQANASSSSASATSGGGEAPGGRTLQDFELILTNTDTNEEYFGDSTSIPKNTSVIVKRVPSQRSKTVRIDADSQGASSDGLFSSTSGVARLAPSSFDLPTAKRLNFGPGPLSSALAVEELRRQRSTGAEEFGEDPLDESGYIQKEEERRAREARERAAAQQAQIAAQQAAIQAAHLAAAEAAQQQRGGAGGGANAMMQQPDVNMGGVNGAQPMVVPYVRPAPSRPPPPYYVCHNCGKSGHWKQSCEFAPKMASATSKFVQIIGGNGAPSAVIPRNLVMHAMAGMQSGAAAVLSAYTNRPQGTMFSSQQQPQHLSASSASTPIISAPIVAPTPPDLTCTYCHRLFNSPMVVPCCFTSFCDECIRQALVMENRCPRCHNTEIGVEQLRTNNVMAKRVAKEQERLALAAKATPQSQPQAYQYPSHSHTPIMPQR